MTLWQKQPKKTLLKDDTDTFVNDAAPSPSCFKSENNFSTSVQKGSIIPSTKCCTASPVSEGTPRSSEKLQVLLSQALGFRI